MEKASARALIRLPPCKMLPTLVFSFLPVMLMPVASMGMPGAVNTGSFQTGFSYQQAQPQQPAQSTRPFQPQAEQQPYGTGQVFPNAPQQPYQPTFAQNGQVTGGFTPIPQTQAMTTDSHGVQGYLRRKK